MKPCSLMRLPSLLLAVNHFCQAAGDRALHQGHAIAPQAHKSDDSSNCDWTVVYNLWQPSFEPGEYEPVVHGGMHCLAACCADPTCKGLSMESHEKYQCYRYKALPKMLASRGVEQLPLGDGQWLLKRPVRWSIFVKHARPVVGHRQPVVPLPVLPAAVPAAASKENALDEELRIVQAKHMPQEGKCQWTVHYDRWISTFDRKEYEDVEKGGEHCLQICCGDPNCKGLAMESSEMYQCYKYSKIPEGLNPKLGRNLSDGVWLLERRPAWSVFVKVEPHAVPAPATRLRQMLQAPGSGTAQPEVPGASWSWRSMQLLLFVAVVLVAGRAYGLPGAKLLAKLESRASEEEGIKLLSTSRGRAPQL